ncbi:SprT family protein [Virgibacillus phasianinus]|uniref:SprT family protein n=1 Tax=Virgibacillus phasianinus TaxID=2017483 RepID=A0A220TZN6_9BACI|nr:SprT family protein [Virgibacillus phasianinus]ASK61242.1 SprT family protein [Virgibacillus phasianinus]
MNLLNEKELYALVQKISLNYFGKSFKDQVRFNSRLRTTGGRYIPSKRIIELNPKYVLETNEAEFIGIIKHELCHYHLHIEGKGYKHGDSAFKMLLKETGSPRHCTPLPSSKRENKHHYICKSCSHVYKRQRRVNINKYRCGRCGGVLKDQ